MVVLAAGLGSRREASALWNMRLAAALLGAYLFFAPTVHPWYVAVLVPLLPFLTPCGREPARVSRLLLPGLAFSGLVALSYLTYLDPANLRETNLVRLLEYLPVYALMMWAALPGDREAFPQPSNGGGGWPG
jgi:hypothetical protein